MDVALLALEYRKTRPGQVELPMGIGSRDMEFQAGIVAIQPDQAGCVGGMHFAARTGHDAGKLDALRRLNQCGTILNPEIGGLVH